MCRDQNVERSHSIKIDNSSLARVEQFQYLATTLRDLNYIPAEINSTYVVHSPTKALFIDLVISFKFTLKYTIISIPTCFGLYLYLTKLYLYENINVTLVRYR